MYVRQDGTRTYFFTIEELTALANDAGLEIEKIEYCQRKTGELQKKHPAVRATGVGGQKIVDGGCL